MWAVFHETFSRIGWRCRHGVEACVWVSQIQKIRGDANWFVGRSAQDVMGDSHDAKAAFCAIAVNGDSPMRVVKRLIS
jgi:hypothetical protein